MDIRIVGLGNVLMGDDGFGPYVIAALKETHRFPADVALIDLGTPGLDLAPFLMGADLVIVVDSVRAAGPPGALLRYTRKELVKHAPPARLGPHDPGFAQCLLTLDFAGCGPRDVVLVGAIPHRIAPCARLSPEVRAAVPGAIEAVLAALAAVGVSPMESASGRMSEPWWERVSPTFTCSVQDDAMA
jgi:hydrogenase maturation protease